MSRYIKNIHIKQVRHLKDINLPLEKEDYPHLMITGKNGSGKTSLLNAMAEYIERIANDSCKLFENVGEVTVAFEDVDNLIRKYQDGNFIIAFYEAHRTIKKLQEPKTPTKPELQDKWGIKQTSTQECLKFLADRKIQEALARNEKLEKDANQIREWFVNFEKLLG